MSIEHPLLIDLPMPLVTKRLVLRPLQEGDGKVIFDATDASRDTLERWLPWPKYVKKWQDSEQFARGSYADVILRKSLVLGMFKEGEFLGTCGFNYFLWNIPSAEIGYWCKSSAQNQGYTQEAVLALKNYGFETIGLKRIVITCLDENEASSRVAEKCGFSFETRAFGLLPNPVSSTTLALAKRYVAFKDHENK